MDLTPDPNLSVRNVGAYELIRKIGEGGMAEVYLARRSGIEGFAHLCVVKTILPTYASDRDFAEMFFDEARITVELQHPNIVRVFDLDRADDLVYLAMEFVDGMDALSLMIECEELGVTVPYGSALYIISETLKGLHFAHSARDIEGKPLGLIHRDISPGNILLGLNGSVKLGDFGVARATISRRAEEPGLIVGKLRYFAPELLLGGEASRSSDVFAVGVCFFEMLAMEPLFPPAENAVQQQMYLRNWHPEKVLEEHLNFPDGMDTILLSALAPDPEDRYQSALEFLEDVTDLAHESQVRLGDQAMIHFLGELKKATEAEAKVQEDPTTRFRDESRQGLTAAVPAPGEAPPDAATAPIRSASGPQVVEEPTDRYQRRPAQQPNQRVNTDKYSSADPTPQAQRQASADAPAPGRVPHLAEMLASGSFSAPPIHAETPLRLGAGRRVDLFTSFGHVGPFDGAVVEAAATRSRASGIELLSIDGEGWEPLVRHSVQAGPTFEQRVQSFGLLVFSHLLLGAARKTRKFELMLWSELSAVYLGVVEGRIVACRAHPEQDGSGRDTVLALASMLRWTQGQALPLAANHLQANPAAPPVGAALVEAMHAALPPHIFRKLDHLRGPLVFRAMPNAERAAAKLPTLEQQVLERLVREPVAARELNAEAVLQAALRLLARGLIMVTRAS